MTGDMTVVKGSGLVGRPPNNARAFLERSRPVLAARWVRSCKRALAHLNDPSVQINGDWIRLFNSLADRIGYVRVSSQRIESDSTSVSATVSLAISEREAQKSQAAARLVEMAEARLSKIETTETAGAESVAEPQKEPPPPEPEASKPEPPVESPARKSDFALGDPAAPWNAERQSAWDRGF